MVRARFKAITPAMVRAARGAARLSWLLPFAGMAAISVAGSAQPIDVKTAVAEAIVGEVRRCHDYMSAHPDVAKGYGPRVGIDAYCDCEANLLVGSVAPDELVRLMFDKQFETKVGQRRHDTGMYCLNLLMKRGRGD